MVRMTVVWAWITFLPDGPPGMLFKGTGEQHSFKLEHIMCMITNKSLSCLLFLGTKYVKVIIIIVCVSKCFCIVSHVILVYMLINLHM